MDELLAGLGKLLGTLELGSVADWTAGLVAFVALLVAVLTQRRQTVELARVEANALIADMQVVSFDLTNPGEESEPPVEALTVKLRNDTNRTIRNVLLRVGSLGLNQPYPPFTFDGYEGDLDSFERRDRLTDKTGEGVWHRVGPIEGGQKIAVTVYTRGGLDREIYILFTDTQGRRWRRDIMTAALRPAKDKDREPFSFLAEKPIPWLPRRKN